MKLVENFKSYSDCKEALIESYGDIDIAKTKLIKKGYSTQDVEDLDESLNAIKESLGDKIINFFSKNLGGGISKIDKLLRDMKEEEIRFIKDEHEAESKFYKLSTALGQLKKDKADKSETDQYIIKLNKIQKLIKDLVSSHSSIMDSLEKQVDILTNKNNRRTEYYNLKRAEDAVETKKLRAEFKRKLVSQEDDAEYLKDIQKILGNPKDAEKDLEDAKKNLAKEKEEIGASDEVSNMSPKKVENILEEYHKEIMASLKDVKDYTEKSLDRIQELSDNKEMNQGAYNAMKIKFESKISKISKYVEEAKSKISQIGNSNAESGKESNQAISYLLNLEKAVTNIKYYTWPAQDLDKEKKEIESALEVVEEEIQKAA
jgi:cancer susceptibility candidate protein 1